ADAPFETAPILEIDGGKKVLGDSLAISRFLAKTFGSDGFIGKTKSDAAKSPSSTPQWTSSCPSNSCTWQRATRRRPVL
ncbi:hypothetical protein PENTCL1PPCAC_19824, partial [Pristionchus entomophagus]